MSDWTAGYVAGKTKAATWPAKQKDTHFVNVTPVIGSWRTSNC